MVAEDLGRRPAPGDPAFGAEDAHRVGELLDGVEVVRREDHRLPRAMLVLDDADDVPRRAGVEPGGRLVEEDRVAADREDAGDRDLPLFPDAQLMGRPVEECLDPEPSGDRVEPVEGFLPRHAELERAEGDVLPDGRAKELGVRVLEHEADLPAKLPLGFRVAHRARVEPLPVGAHLPRVGEDEGVKDRKERGLSRAVRADERDARVSLDGEVEVAERRDA